MKIALLTGGPSITEQWCDDFAPDYDRVIAVNGAAFHFAADYVAFVDRVIWEAMQSGRAHRPRVGYITHENWPIPATMEWHNLPLYQARYGRVPKAIADAQNVTECGFTFPSALRAAQDMAEGGPLDIYGFDYSLEPNVLGIEVCHPSLRWLLELDWVKHSWGPNIRTFGRVHPDVLAWLRGEGGSDAKDAAIGIRRT